MGGFKSLLGDTLFSERYPNAPGFKERGTSEEAAQSMRGRADTLRDKVFQAIRRYPMTADEVAADLGESVLSIRPRLSELVARGLIFPTEQRRANRSGRSAMVWRAKV